MKILHLFSDWKWTGPAEPALQLAIAQREAGRDVQFICGAPPPDAEQSIVESARRAGFSVDTSLRMSKHRNPLANVLDRRALRPRLRDEGFDVVHTHRGNDHLVGGRAARAVDRSIRIVRTVYDAVVPESRGSRRLLERYSDGVIAVSRKVADDLRQRAGGDGPAVTHVPAGVDLQRFHPGVDAKAVREELGISPTAPVAGVVARMQFHRRFEVLLPALRRAHDAHPELRTVIYGRGTNREVVAMQPVREMGLSDVILFPGYRDRDYPEALAAIDFLIFLVPGSDASCRAVRQAMAIGKPVIAARRGMLPEIVDHERNGLVVDDDEERLFESILSLARDAEKRERWGREAARKARDEYDLRLQAERVSAFYEALA